MDDRKVAAAAFMTGSFADILAPDVMVVADGMTLRGRDTCALYLAGVLVDLAPNSIDAESINGEPGLALRRAGHVVGVVILGSHRARIDHVWLVTAPEKLRSWD